MVDVAPELFCHGLFFDVGDDSLSLSDFYQRIIIRDCVQAEEHELRESQPWSYIVRNVCTQVLIKCGVVHLLS